MNSDIRVSVSFLDHPKTIKLRRRLGWEGFESLLRLWFWAAQHRPNGILSDLSDEDIEIAARWVGDQGMLVALLVELRFLDFSNGVFALHDWEDHNGWACHAKERSDKAKKAAAAKWGKRSLPPEDVTVHAPSDTTSTATSSALGIACGIAPSPNPNPSPNPSPNSKAALASNDDIAVLKARHCEVCGLAASPPLSAYSRWLSAGKSVEDILRVYEQLGGYPLVSRQRLLLDFIDKPKDVVVGVSSMNRKKETPSERLQRTVHTQDEAVVHEY